MHLTLKEEQIRYRAAISSGNVDTMNKVADRITRLLATMFALRRARRELTPLLVGGR